MLTDSQAISEKIAKLPEWARIYISNLKQELANANEVINSQAKGDTAITWTNSIDNEFNVPSDADVRFDLEGSGGVTVFIYDSDTLIIRSERGKLNISPQSANSIVLSVSGW